MRRVIAAITAAAVVLFVAWCGGQDFDTRNSDLMMVAIVAIAAAVFASTCPFLDRR